MPSRGPRSQMDRSSFGGPSIWNRGAHPSPEIIHIGCAGWNIPRQSVAHFELEGTHLERYSRTFNCCEINSSFYRPTQVFHLGTMVPHRYRKTFDFPLKFRGQLPMKSS